MVIIQTVPLPPELESPRAQHAGSEFMTGVPASVGRKPRSRLQGLKCRRAVKARDQLQPTSAQRPNIKTTAVCKHPAVAKRTQRVQCAADGVRMAGGCHCGTVGGRPWSGVED